MKQHTHGLFENAYLILFICTNLFTLLRAGQKTYSRRSSVKLLVQQSYGQPERSASTAFTARRVRNFTDTIFLAKDGKESA